MSLFLHSSDTFAVPESPDYLGAGDFDNDGHADLIAAARGSQRLYFLSGDGTGRFRQPRAVALPGGITAFAVGDVNRADGLADVVVGTSGTGGPQVLIFEHPLGAIKAAPEIFSVLPPVTDLALSRFDDDHAVDVAVAAGSHLMIIHGRDRKLSLNAADRAAVKPAFTSQLTFHSTILSLAGVRSSSTRQSEIAVLMEDGEVQIASVEKTEQANRHSVKSRTVSDQRWLGASKLISASSSTAAADDLILVDQSHHRVHVLRQGPETVRALNESLATASSLDARSFDIAGEPVAVLPVRVNGDALSDLIVL
jgi:hypothetical protein